LNEISAMIDAIIMITAKSWITSSEGVGVEKIFFDIGSKIVSSSDATHLDWTLS